MVIQKVLTKYWLSIHVGLFFLFSCLWLCQTHPFSAVHLAWLALLAIEAFVLLPSVRRGETLADARRRVMEAMVWDPFSYIAIAILFYALMQWINSGRTLIYRIDVKLWMFSEPMIMWLPSSIAYVDALTNLCVLLAVLTGCLLLRQGIGKSVKRTFLYLAAGFSGGLALIMGWMAMCGIEPSASLLRGLWSNGAGSFFAFWLVMGIGVTVDARARQQRGVSVLYVLAVFGNILGVFLFAHLPILLVYAGVVLLLIGYALVYLRSYVSVASEVKSVLITVLLSGVLAFVMYSVLPVNPVMQRLKTMSSSADFMESMYDSLAVRKSSAMTIWEESPWSGVGPNGFYHLVGTVIQNKQWPLLNDDQSAVHNDCLQFLCENGILGFGLFVSAVIILLVSVCYRMRLAWLNDYDSWTKHRLFLFQISPLVMTGVLATMLCFLESWIASPLRTPAVLLSWLFVIVSMPAFLPSKREVVAK